MTHNYKSSFNEIFFIQFITRFRIEKEDHDGRYIF